MSRKFEPIYSYLKEHLPKERLRHVLCVAKMAKDLAVQHGESLERAELASLLHDVARRWEEKELIKYVEKNAVVVPEKEFICTVQPLLLHSYVGADIAMKKFNVTDREILGAIRKHSLGDGTMSKFEKLIYLADLISYDRKYPACAALRTLALKNLDAAYREGIAIKLKHLLEKGLSIHPLTIQAWNKLARARANING